VFEQIGNLTTLLRNNSHISSVPKKFTFTEKDVAEAIKDSYIIFDELIKQSTGDIKKS
jgi:hypothetical protein